MKNSLFVDNVRRNIIDVRKFSKRSKHSFAQKALIPISVYIGIESGDVELLVGHVRSIAAAASISTDRLIDTGLPKAIQRCRRTLQDKFRFSFRDDEPFTRYA